MLYDVVPCGLIDGLHRRRGSKWVANGEPGGVTWLLKPVAHKVPTTLNRPVGKHLGGRVADPAWIVEGVHIDDPMQCGDFHAPHRQKEEPQEKMLGLWAHDEHAASLGNRDTCMQALYRLLCGYLSRLLVPSSPCQPSPVWVRYQPHRIVHTVPFSREPGPAGKLPDALTACGATPTAASRPRRCAVLRSRDPLAHTGTVVYDTSRSDDLNEPRPDEVPSEKLVGFGTVTATSTAHE